MYKNSMQICFAKIFANLSQDCLALFYDSCTTLCECCASCCREILANLHCKNFRHSYKCRMTVVQKLIKHANNSQLSGEKINLSDIHTNVVKHSQDCLATRTGENENELHSQECRETLS